MFSAGNSVSGSLGLAGSKKVIVYELSSINEFRFPPVCRSIEAFCLYIRRQPRSPGNEDEFEPDRAIRSFKFNTYL